MLTAEQIAHYEAFGFLAIRQLFTAEEMDDFSHEADNVLSEDRQDRPFAGDRRHAIMAFVEKSPLLTRMPVDDRVYLPVEQLLGPDLVWTASDGNLRVGDTAWHPDGSEEDYRRIKVAFYLDPVGPDTGCLRVIPGSHLPPLHREMGRLLDEDRNPIAEVPDSGRMPFGVASSELPSESIPTDPGDAIFFNQNLWHGTFGGSVGRRQFSVTFYAEPTTDPHIAYLKQVCRGDLEEIKRFQRTQTDRLYKDAFLNNGDPRWKGLLRYIHELEFR